MSGEHESTVAILGYHNVGEPAPDGWETWYQIPEALFAEHLALLRDEGWEVLDAGAFLAGLSDPGLLPARAALITFDDGYRALLQTALPSLQRFGFPAVMFMPTDLIACDNQWDSGSEPPARLCDWDDLRALVRGGVSIQSHAASHRAFSELSASELSDELERSKATLEAGLEARVELLAFPYGDDAGSTPQLRAALAGAGYRAACGYGGEPVRFPGADPYRLDRVAIGPDTDLAAVLAGAATA